MIEYTSGLFTEIVEPIIDEVENFIRLNTDAYVDRSVQSLHMYRSPDQDVRAVLAHSEGLLVGFYLWRPFEKSPFLNNNPALADELSSIGLNVSEIYNPLLLAVDVAYRRQKIASFMADRAQSDAIAEGFVAQVIYLIKSETTMEYKNSLYGSSAITLQYKDAFGDQIQVHRVSP